MRNKIIGILIALGLTSSCQNKEKKGNSSEPDNNVNIEFTDDNGSKNHTF